MLEAKFWDDDKKRFQSDAIRKDLDAQVFCSGDEEWWWCIADSGV